MDTHARTTLSVDELTRRPFVLVHEAASFLGMDERTVRRAIKSGEIPAIRIRGATRIPTAWLLAAASGVAAPVSPEVVDLAERRPGRR